MQMFSDITEYRKSTPERLSHEEEKVRGEELTARKGKGK